MQGRNISSNVYFRTLACHETLDDIFPLITHRRVLLAIGWWKLWKLDPS